MIQIGAIVGEIWRIGSEMWGSRRGQLDVCPGLFSGLGAIGSYLWVLSLENYWSGAHGQFTFKKHPHLGPQLTPSGSIHKYIQLVRRTYVHTEIHTQFWPTLIM